VYLLCTACLLACLLCLIVLPLLILRNYSNAYVMYVCTTSQVLRGGATGAADMANWDANLSVNARAAFCFLTHATPHLKAVNEAAGGGDKVLGKVARCSACWMVETLTGWILFLLHLQIIHVHYQVCSERKYLFRITRIWKRIVSCVSLSLKLRLYFLRVHNFVCLFLGLDLLGFNE